MAGCRVYNDANIAIATATWTALTFNSERFDRYDDAASTYHSTASNTARITIPSGRGGFYLIGADATFAADSAGRRGIRIVHSVGSTVIGTEIYQATTAGALSMSIATFYELAAAEYVTAEVFQNSGGNLNITANGNDSPEFWACLVGV